MHQKQSNMTVSAFSCCYNYFRNIIINEN